MSSLQIIQDFLAQKQIAVVGVSHDPKDFSWSLFREFKKRGYKTLAVNPQVNEVDGEPCYPNLSAAPAPIDGVVAMTSPGVTDEVAHECGALGIKRLWMYRAGGQGAVNEDAARYCEANGIAVVPGECPFMFLAGGAWFHGLHGFIRKITGSYPK
jgi:hypothetical protein